MNSKVIDPFSEKPTTTKLTFFFFFNECCIWFSLKETTSASAVPLSRDMGSYRPACPTVQGERSPSFAWQSHLPHLRLPWRRRLLHIGQGCPPPWNTTPSHCSLGEAQSWPAESNNLRGFQSSCGWPESWTAHWGKVVALRVGWKNNFHFGLEARKESETWKW